MIGRLREHARRWNAPLIAAAVATLFSSHCVVLMNEPLAATLPKFP